MIATENPRLYSGIDVIRQDLVPLVGRLPEVNDRLGILSRVEIPVVGFPEDDSFVDVITKGQ